MYIRDSGIVFLSYDNSVRALSFFLSLSVKGMDVLYSLVEK